MKGQPDIIATVRLYTTEAGGRKGPTPAETFGCLFEFQGDMFDCRLLLKNVGALAPGSQATVPIVFLYPELIKLRLEVGSRFTLWEAPTIGEGIVDRIVSD